MPPPLQDPEAIRTALHAMIARLSAAELHALWEVLVLLLPQGQQSHSHRSECSATQPKDERLCA